MATESTEEHGKKFHRRVTKNAEKNFNLKNTQSIQIKSEAAKFNLPLNSF